MKKYSTLLVLRKMQIKNYNEIAFHTHQIGQKCKFLVIPKHGRHWKNIQQFHSHIYTSEKQVQVLWDVQTRTNAALLFPSGLNRKQPSPPTADRMNCGTAAWWHGITKHWKRKVPLKNKINKERPNKRVDSIYASSKINQNQTMLFGIHT